MGMQVITAMAMPANEYQAELPIHVMIAPDWNSIT